MRLNSIKRLFVAESIKLYLRKELWIMLPLIIIASLTYGIILKNYSTKPDKQDLDYNWKAIVQTVINDYDPKNVNDNTEKFPDLLREAYGKMQAVYQYQLDNNIPRSSWKCVVLKEIIVLESNLVYIDEAEQEQRKNMQDKIKKLYEIIEADNWKEYLGMQNQDIRSNDRYSNPKEIQDILIEANNFRIENNIAPDLNDNDWRNTLVKEIIERKERLVRSSLYKNMEEYKLSDIEKERLQQEIDIMYHRINTNNPPVEEKSYRSFLAKSTDLVMLIVLFIIIIAGAIVASEFSNGSIKLSMISPYKRWKVLLSKYLVIFSTAVGMLIILYISSVVLGMFIYSDRDLSKPFLYFSNNSVQEMNYLIYIGSKYIMSGVTLLMMTTLAIMLSVLIKNSSIAIGVSIFLTFAGDAAVKYLSIGLKSKEWLKYILFSNMDLSQYFGGEPIVGSMTLGFSIAILIGYFIIMVVTTLDAYNKVNL